MPFQVDYIPLELLRDHEPVRNLVWKCGLPDFENVGGSMLAHDFHNIRRCDCSCIWESFKKSTDSKPMVSMAVSNVDGCQVLTFCCNPICQSVGLLDRHKGIHQDCVPHAINEPSAPCCHRCRLTPWNRSKQHLRRRGNLESR